MSISISIFSLMHNSNTQVISPIIQTLWRIEEFKSYTLALNAIRGEKSQYFTSIKDMRIARCG